MGLFISFLLMFSGVSFGYGMDCEKPTISPSGGSATFTFDCKNTTDVTFGSYQIFPISVSGATVTATACSGSIAPGVSCTVEGTFTTSTVGLYELDFDDKYSGERHYGIFCNNPQKGCIEVDVTTIIQVGDYLADEGGVVFYIDPNGGDTLIVALNDAGSLQWSPNQNNVTTSTALYSGATNTDNMNNSVMNPGLSPAATACINYPDSHHDWYVPSRDELLTLWSNSVPVNVTLASHGTAISPTLYWSSSQFDFNFNYASNVDFFSGGQFIGNKVGTHLVRCVRAF